MNANTLIMILNKLISAYSWLIFIRVILSWVPYLYYKSRLVQVVYALTDPYLNFFRRIFHLSFFGIDFSVIIAFLSLSFLQNFLTNILLGQHITLALVVSYVVFAVFAVSKAIFNILMIFALIRLVTLLLRLPTGPFLTFFDLILSKPVHWLGMVFARGRTVRYTTLLAALSLICFLSYRGLGIAYVWSMVLVSMIPF